MATSEPAALNTLADLLDELCLEIAQMQAEADEHRDAIRERALFLRNRVAKVGRMAGIDVPQPAIQRVVRRVAS